MGSCDAASSLELSQHRSVQFLTQRPPLRQVLVKQPSKSLVVMVLQQICQLQIEPNAPGFGVTRAPFCLIRLIPQALTVTPRIGCHLSNSFGASFQLYTVKHMANRLIFLLWYLGARSVTLKHCPLASGGCTTLLYYPEPIPLPQKIMALANGHAPQGLSGLGLKLCALALDPAELTDRCQANSFVIYRHWSRHTHTPQRRIDVHI